MPGEGFEISQQPKSENRNLYDVKSAVYRIPKLAELTKGARADEYFLNLCREFELRERGGELPGAYSGLSLEDIRHLKEGKSPVNLLSPEAEIEADRVKETIEVLNSHDGQTAIVDSAEKIINPVGEIELQKGNLDIWIQSDTHLAPSNVFEGIRAEAFKSPFFYRIQRRFQKILDKIQSFWRFRHLKNKEDKNNLLLRYILHEDTRNLFNTWKTEVVSKVSGEDFNKGNLNSIIYADLGDKVHDGAYFIDQLDAQTREYSVIDTISESTRDRFGVKRIKTYLFELFGNHDQDSRIPESFSKLTELFGHRVFAQEAGNVLIVGLDTDIENPEWLRIFNDSASDQAKELLKKRKELQEKVLVRMQDHEGPVVLMGHAPSRIIDSFGMKADEKYPQRRELFQNCKASEIRIVSGHTHKEEHVEVPITTLSGGKIRLDVLESFVKFSKDMPIPPKLFRLRIRGGKIEGLETYQENKSRFESRYKDLVASQEVMGSKNWDMDKFKED